MEHVLSISRTWKMGGDDNPTCPSCVLRGDLEVKAVGDPLICTGNFKSSHFNERKKKKSMQKIPVLCLNQHN